MIGTANIEGRLTIRIGPAQGQVEIASTRPLLASRLFEGKVIDEVLNTIPLLFNVCGRAQSVAAIRAIESARQTSATGPVEQGRSLLIQLETLREHLWRVLLEWPEFHGQRRETVLLAGWMADIQAINGLIDPNGLLCREPGLSQAAAPSDDLQRRLATLCDGLGQGLFGCLPQRFATFDADALDDWVDNTDTPATRMLQFVRDRGWEALGPTSAEVLPALPAEALRARIDANDADGFIARPTWDGQPRETGPAARHSAHPLIKGLQGRYGRGLLVHLAARLLDMAETIVGLRGPLVAERPMPDVPGLCQLEAARGRLCHRVLLDGGRIERYRILAPTEWNFGREGPAAQALADITDPQVETAKTQAQLLIHAIDPCVGYDLEVQSPHA
jgi:coenzyme F420-reducing hydrogenase alpha subunit